MTDYAFLSDIRSTMNTDLSESDFVTRVRGLIRSLSASVELATMRRFDHRVDTVPHDIRRVSDEGDISEDGYTLLLRDDLQVLSGITIDSIAMDASLYQVLPLSMPAYRPYKDRVMLTQTSNLWSAYAGGTTRPELTIMVTGIWGWGGTWKRITTLSADVDIGDNTLPLTALDKVEYGKVLRIEDEYCEVDDETEVLVSPISVVRASNGSVEVAHATATPVYVYIPHPVVTRLVKRLVMWQSELDDSPLFSTVELGDFSQPVDLSVAPKDAKETIAMLSDRESPN